MEDFVGYRGFYQSVSIDEHLFIQATTSAFAQMSLTYIRKEVAYIDELSCTPYIAPVARGAQLIR